MIEKGVFGKMDKICKTRKHIRSFSEEKWRREALIDAEIARQTVARTDSTRATSQTVTDDKMRGAITWLENGYWLRELTPTKHQIEYTKHDKETCNIRELAITALQQMRTENHD